MNNFVGEGKRSALRQRCFTVVRMSAVWIILLLAGNFSAANAFQTPDPAALLAAYNQAIYDSSVYKFSNLRPLNPLKFDPVTKSATVVTLTDYDYTENGKLKPPFPTDTSSHYIWVTAVPEVRDLCRKMAPGELQLSLSQLLGLPPESSFKYFVTLEITSGQVFRPAAYPDPTTEYPCATTGANIAPAAGFKQTTLPDNCGEALAADICDVDYKMWFLNKILSSYVISSKPTLEGYPWTRLGYTYNWKPGADRYGASEYVIKLNSVVTVREIASFQDYCRPVK